jgi:hypothetical protein
MAANDEFIHVWKEDTDGTKNLQVIQKIDSDFGSNGIEDLAIPTGKLADDAGIVAGKLATGSVTGAKVAALANDATAPQVEVLIATAIANATGDEDITLALPAGTTWAVTNAWVEQDVGNAATDNTYILKKGAAVVGATITGLAQDGAINPLPGIPAASKANNSFANGDVLRWSVVAGGTQSAAGVAYTKLRRLT